MLETRVGTVRAVRRLEDGTLRLEVDVKGETRPALAFAQIAGAVETGDRVLVNTTAISLKLGTGGLDFVVANLSNPSGKAGEAMGHIMKLRYSPLQFAVSCEEESPDGLEEFPDLQGMPVVAAGLHSQVAGVAAGVKALKPDARVVYIMTDGASLPLGLSDLVRTLTAEHLLDETITCGQAFGGGREAVNIPSALAVAKLRAQADVAIVCQGPGGVGTGTAVGYSGIEQGAAINAAHSLNARPVAAVRMSQADPRERHRLISHHTLTVLSRMALAPAIVALPFMEDAPREQAIKQLSALKLFEYHEIRMFDGQPGLDLLDQRDIVPVSMGRSPEDDPLFFLAASAAGRAAAEMLAEDFAG